MYTLSKSDPQAWENFVIAYKAYFVSELEWLLTASGGDAKIAVGMGRRMRELRDDISGIEVLMAKLSKK